MFSSKKISLSLLLLASLHVSVSALSLDKAVETAINNSLDLQKVQNNIDLAKSDKKSKQSANYGRFDVLASYNHYNLPRTLAPLTPASLGSSPQAIATTKDLFSAGIAYNLELFNGLQDKRDIEISSLQEEITKARKHLSKEQIIYNVKTLYINILSLQAHYEAQANYVLTLQTLYEDIAYKVKLERLARIDLLKASADLESSKATLSEIETNIIILKSSLASAMYVERVEDLDPINIDVKGDETSPLMYRDKLHTTSRMHLATLDVQKRNKQENKSLAVYYPKVGFNGYYGQNIGFNDETHVNPGDWNNAEIWQVGLDLKWNILDFGKSSSVREKSQIIVMQSKLEERKVRRDLERLLTEATSKLDLAVTRSKSASSELALMDETQKIEVVRYESGASDINDLLYTKARYQLAKSRYISAQYAYENARVYLDYVVEKGSEK